MEAEMGEMHLQTKEQQGFLATSDARRQHPGRRPQGRAFGPGGRTFPAAPRRRRDSERLPPPARPPTPPPLQNKGYSAPGAGRLQTSPVLHVPPSANLNVLPRRGTGENHYSVPGNGGEGHPRKERPAPPPGTPVRAGGQHRCRRVRPPPAPLGRRCPGCGEGGCSGHGQRQEDPGSPRQPRGKAARTLLRSPGAEPEPGAWRGAAGRGRRAPPGARPGELGQSLRRGLRRRREQHVRFELSSSGPGEYALTHGQARAGRASQGRAKRPRGLRGRVLRAARLSLARRFLRYLFISSSSLLPPPARARARAPPPPLGPRGRPPGLRLRRGGDARRAGRERERGRRAARRRRGARGRGGAGRTRAKAAPRLPGPGRAPARPDAASAARPAAGPSPPGTLRRATAGQPGEREPALSQWWLRRCAVRLRSPHGPRPGPSGEPPSTPGRRRAEPWQGTRRWLRTAGSARALGRPRHAPKPPRHELRAPMPLLLRFARR
ncbi:collagen alpha-1(I) chain-like [Balaenoptera musculus]|uniref:Collagen alpha-1(I) chain-like n=1 Tax=Balaenoptera musculus TaxID=9771 RepID=A0A8B8WCP9_BALMU|nr:collagen alpha-1(I) chain-like [Balaenoptera musculus]